MTRLAAAWRRVLAVPTWRLIQAAMLTVLATAFVTSFSSGSAGAGRLGFPPAFVAALPLVCDVVAGMATAIHGRVRRDPAMRRLAAWYVLVPMLLSWGANSVDHLFRATPTAVGWPVGGQWAWYAAVVLAAGICPVAVAALLHLSTRFVEFEQRQVERATAARASRAPRPPAPPRTGNVDEVDERRKTRDRERKAAYRARKRAEAASDG